METKVKTCSNCGAPVDRVRSPEHHRRFFGLMNAAYEQWPETHEFQPDSSDHLRAYLLCKAGHRNVVTIPFESDDLDTQQMALRAVEQGIAAAGAYAFIRPHGNSIAVFSSKTIKWSKMSQSKFAPIAQAVDEIVEDAIGSPTDQILRERAA